MSSIQNNPLGGAQTAGTQTAPVPSSAASSGAGPAGSSSAAPGMTADSFLWYNLGNYGNLALAVPNCGANQVTQNSPLYSLVLRIGRALQAIMFRADARMSGPPQVNTVVAMIRECNRLRSILQGNTVPEGSNQMLLESSRATPPTYIYQVFPTPFFNVTNFWMQQYCMYMLLALEECMQSEENGRALEITAAISNVVLPYEQRIQKLIATDLLQIPLPNPVSQPNGTVVNNVVVYNPADPNFVITPAVLQAFPYSPSQIATPSANTASPPDPSTVPTAATIAALAKGFPVSTLGALQPWPGTSGGTGAAG